MNIEQTKKAIQTCHDSNITPLLVGHRGIGKTELTKQYCKENGYGLVELRLGQADGAGDLIGLADFLTDKEGNKIATKFITPHFLPTNGKWIIFLDEINRGTKDVLQACFELVYDKSISINGYKLPEGSHVIAAKNPETDEYDTLNFQDSAFQDRFCHIKVEPGVKEWLGYGKKINMDNTILNFIQEMPKMLEPKLSDFTLDVSPSRRSWEAVSRIEKNNPDQSIFLEVVQGLIGVEAAVSYSKFKDEEEKVITGEQVLNDYDSVKKTIVKFSDNETNRSDSIDATKTLLVEHLNTMESLSTLQEDNLFNFLQDIPKDMAFSVIKDLVTIEACLSTEKDPENGIGENPVFVEFAKVLTEFTKEKSE